MNILSHKQNCLIVGLLFLCFGAFGQSSAGPNAIIGSWMKLQRIDLNENESYFSVNQAVFTEFINSEGITVLYLDYYTRKKTGEDFIYESADVLTGSEFNSITTYKHAFVDLDVSQYDLYVEVSSNLNNCSDMRLLEYEGFDSTTPLEEFPNVGCSAPEPPVVTDLNSDPISIHDVLMLGGLPVVVQAADLKDGAYNGSGYVAVPFGPSLLNVTFSALKANSAGEVIQGTVKSINDAFTIGDEEELLGPLNQPVEEFCIVRDPVEQENAEGPVDLEGFDSWGFDEDGNHYKTGGPYDENGFDKDGIHKDSKGLYNEDGCSRRGRKEDGSPCNPSGEPYDLSVKLAKNIDGHWLEVADDLLVEYNAYLATLNCAAIKQQITNELGQNGDLVTGKNGFSIQDDISTKHEKPFKKSADFNGKSQNIQDLERLHEEYYQCDLELKYYTSFTDLLSSILESEYEIDQFTEVLAERVRNWTEIMYNINQPNLNEWLKEQIILYIEENGSLKGVGFNDIEVFNEYDPYYGSASLVSTSPLLSMESRISEVNFLLNQGERMLFDRPRSFYMDAMANTTSTDAGVNSPLRLKPLEQLGLTPDIILENFRWTIANGNVTAFVNAHCVLKDPFSNKHIGFTLENVSFNNAGLNPLNDNRLKLATDAGFRINNVTRLGLEKEKVFLSWDCNGFQYVNIGGYIEICPSVALPVGEDNKVKEDEFYKVSFDISADIQNWPDFTIAVEGAGKFTTPKWTDLIIDPGQIYVDNSRRNSLSGVQLPPEYMSPFYSGGQLTKEWKGLIVRGTKIYLSPGFKADSNAPVDMQIDVDNLVIDDYGITLQVQINPSGGILSFDEAQTKAGDFSIDGVNINIVQNRFIGGGINGRVRLAVIKEVYTYKGIVLSPNLYQLEVSPKEDVSMDLFIAKGTLSKNSKVIVTLDEIGLRLDAELHGKLTIKTDGLNVGILKGFAPGVEFKNFKISSRPKYFEEGTWGVTAGSSLSNGSILGIIEKPYLYKAAADDELVHENNIGLGFRVNIDVFPEVSAGVDLGILSSYDIDIGEQRYKWNFEKVQVSGAQIDMEFNGFARVKGAVHFRENDTWGKYWRGDLTVSLEKISTDVFGVAHFGNLNGDKYYYVDAIAKLGSDTPSPGLIKFKGFGGGFCKNMEMDFVNTNLFGSKKDDIIDDHGSSYSGTRYSINTDKNWQLSVNTIFTGPDERLFNGIGRLHVSTTDAGGLETISLLGEAQFIAVLDTSNIPQIGLTAMDFLNEKLKLDKPISFDVPLNGYTRFVYNNKDKIFSGITRVYLNTPFIRGAGHDGTLVNSTMYFGPEKWYVYIGTPQNRLGFEIGGLPLLPNIRPTGYFMFGTEMPPIGDPPAEVSEILSSYKASALWRESGGGLAFGASLTAEAGFNAAEIVSANIKAGLGADIMVRKFRDDLLCDGNTLGINGWYGMGRAWAYLDGSVKVLGAPFASVATAALLEIRGPNPFYMQGIVGAKVKLIGPIPDINVEANVSVGNDCVPENINDAIDPELGINIVRSISPMNDSEGISHATDFYVHFEVPLKERVAFDDLYQIELESCELYDADGLVIYTTKSWGSKASKTLKLNVTEILDNRESYMIKVIVNVMDGEGNVLSSQEAIADYVSAEMPQEILSGDVTDSYPVIGMSNLYKEYEKDAFISLGINYDHLLNDPNASYSVRITSRSGDVTHHELNYDRFDNIIRYELPREELVLAEMYRLEVLKSEIAQESALAYEGFSEASSISKSDEVNNIIYTQLFRVSEYADLKDKIIDIANIPNDSENIYKNCVDIEPFGVIEEIYFTRTVSDAPPFKRRDNAWETDYLVELVAHADAQLNVIQNFERDIVSRRGLNNGVKIFGKQINFINQTVWDGGELYRDEHILGPLGSMHIERTREQAICERTMIYNYAQEIISKQFSFISSSNEYDGGDAIDIDELAIYLSLMYDELTPLVDLSGAKEDEQKVRLKGWWNDSHVVIYDGSRIAEIDLQLELPFNTQNCN